MKADAISMQREDLFLSPSEVRVRYEMRNDTGRPVTLRIAFPMPEVPSNSPDGLTTSSGTYNNIAMKPPTEANFMAFRVLVDGRTLEPEVVRCAKSAACRWCCNPACSTRRTRRSSVPKQSGD